MVVLMLWTVSFARGQQATIFPSLPAAGDGSRLVTDVFLGRNTVGPYLLSWKNIESGSEIVTRGALHLQRDQDYRMDPATGALTFTAPLRSQEIARVDYLCLPGKAIANTPVSVQPMQFNLFEQGHGALSLSALYRPDVNGPSGAASSPDGGLMLLGFNGSAQPTPQSSLTSRFYLDAHGGSILDRGALQVGEKSKTRYGQFSLGFTRGGSAFMGSKETNIAAGRQILEAAGSLNPIYGIQASASFTQTTELPEKGRGATVTAFGQKLSGALGPATRFLATRSETTTDPGDGTASTRVANRIQLDQRFGSNTQATALFDMTENTAGDTHSIVQTSTLTVRSQPDKAVSLQGSYQNRLLPSGAVDATNLRVDAEPTKKVKLSALLGDKFDRNGALRSREATLEYTPSGSLALTSSVQVRGDGEKESLAGGFGATARPNPFLEISGRVRMREETVKGVPDPNTPDTYDVKLSLHLPGNVARLTGGFADNPEDDKGNVLRARSRSIGLQSTLGRFDLAGGYTYQDDYLSPRINTILDLRLGWRPARTTQIVTSYRDSETWAQGILETDTYSLSLTHRIGSSLDLMLSGSMTTTFQNGLWQPDPDYRADARLGLRF
jgi:hypothetical protein